MGTVPPVLLTATKGRSMTIRETLEQAARLQLFERAPLLRLGYTAKDGTPRVIPTGYLVEPEALVFYTIPTSAKVIALRHDPRVAGSIDVGGMPPCALLVRGTVDIETVDGIPDGYFETGRRTMPAEAYPGWDQGVRAMYDSMTVLTMHLTWAKLLDFEHTAPSEVERIARAKGLG
jgi:hypothetical protein